MGIEKFFKPLETKKKIDSAKKNPPKNDDDDFQAGQSVQKTRGAKSKKDDKVTVDPSDYFDSKPASTSKAKPVSKANSGSAKSTQQAAAAANTARKPKKKRTIVVSDDNDDDDDDYKDDKAHDSEDNDDDFIDDASEEEEKPAKKKRVKKANSPQPTAPPLKKAKRALPTAETGTAPTKATAEPASEKEEKPKPSSAKRNYFQMMKSIEPPKLLGTRPEPVGAPNCLEGKAFVISGQYETLTRDQTRDIVMRYGGRITGAVSGKTNYLLKGRDAGESKTAKAKSLGTVILDEDAFYDFINGFNVKTESDKVEQEDKNALAKVKEEPSIVASTSSGSKGKGKATTASKLPRTSSVTASSASTPRQDVGSLLWTEKYKPTDIKDIIGNKDLVARISEWLANFDRNRQNGFKSQEDDLSRFRAIIISGPPGIGKTTTAHIVAKVNGYEVLEFNASDTRSKKVLEEGITQMMDNRSITEFFKSPSPTATKKASALKEGKVVLIMDEVDGMSGGDRGGSVELARQIKTSKIPVICICNDVRSDKVAPLLRVCYDARFRRPTALQIRARMMSIAHKEGLKVEPNAIDQLVQVTQNDIRQVINILSMHRVKDAAMTYDNAKKVGQSSQKNTIMNLFEIPGALLSSGSWNSKSLNEKYEAYFHDYVFANLMIQENYLKTRPSKARNENPRVAECEAIDLIAKAANAVADGDLVDRMIHGPVQHWSLMPVHSIFSCVRPAAYVEGYFGERVNFPAWLGQNSKMNKHQRALNDLQTRMRVLSSGDKVEVRENYLPLLTDKIVRNLQEKDFEGAIKVMDTYYLDRDNLDTMNDLAFPEHAGDKAPFMTIPTANKTAFTRAYNGRDHPVLFQESATAVKKAVSEPKEDAVGTLLEEDELSQEAPEEDDDAIDEDPGKDKYIKEKQAKSTTATKGKKRKTATAGPSKTKRRK